MSQKRLNEENLSWRRVIINNKLYNGNKVHAIVYKSATAGLKAENTIVIKYKYQIQAGKLNRKLQQDVLFTEKIKVL